MSNLKIWKRNYWNMFSALYGTYEESNETTTEPDHNHPYVRDLSGSYKRIISPQNAHCSLLARGVALSGTPAYMYGKNQNTTVYNDADATFNILMGTGTGELDIDKANLFEPLYNSNSLFTSGSVTYSYSYDENTHTYSRTFKIPFVYNGDNPVTITEYGLVGWVPYERSNYNSNYCCTALLYHELFEEGITLEKSDVIEITFTQSIAQPNYTPYPTE